MYNKHPRQGVLNNDSTDQKMLPCNTQTSSKTAYGQNLYSRFHAYTYTCCTCCDAAPPLDHRETPTVRQSGIPDSSWNTCNYQLIQAVRTHTLAPIQDACSQAAPNRGVNTYMKLCQIADCVTGCRKSYRHATVGQVLGRGLIFAI